MGKGRRFELDMVNDVLAAVDTDAVFASALDFSGVAGDSDADIQVIWPSGRDCWDMALIELKKRSGDSGKRFGTHPLAGSTPEQCGMDELRRLVNSGPTWATSWFVLKPDHRELVVFDAEWLLWHVTDGDEGRGPPYTTEPSDAALNAFQPRLTRGNNISMRKPTLEEWNSTTGGIDDENKLLKGIGVQEYYINK